MDRYQQYYEERKEAKAVQLKYMASEVEKYRKKCKTLHYRAQYSSNRQYYMEYEKMKAIFDYLRGEVNRLFDIKL